MTKPKIIRRPDYFWFSHENFFFPTSRRQHPRSPNFDSPTYAPRNGHCRWSGAKLRRWSEELEVGAPQTKRGARTFGLVGPNKHLRPTGAPNKLSTTRSVSQTKIARSEASHRTNIARSSAYQQIKQSSVYQTIHITLDMLGR